MLLQMRSFTRSWVAYLLLFILAAMFVFFLGPGQNLLDVLQLNPNTNVAQGRGFKVTQTQLSREFSNFITQSRNREQPVTQAEAIENGLQNRILEGLIARGAMGAYAKRIGVSASNVQVGTYIHDLPPVQNPLTGEFDRESYQRLLIEFGYSKRGEGDAPEADHAAFEEEIRNQLTASMLIESLALGARTPSAYGRLALAYESERRTVSLAEVPATLIGAIPQPTPAQIQTYYEQNSARLQVPEYRALTLVLARASDFLARVNIPEARVRAEFETRRANLTQPERRNFVRIAAASQAQADDAVARLGRGEAPDAVARALGAQITHAEQQARGDITDAGVAEAVFSMNVNSPARAMRSQLTPWTVVKLVSITPEQAPDFANVGAEIRQDMAQEEAAAQLAAAVAAFEEERAAGGAIQQAARNAGLAIAAIPAVNAEGRTPQGQPVEGLPQDMLDIAFQTAEGEASDFLPVGEADVLLSVDRITPATTRPLDEVRAALTTEWIARERATRLQNLATEITNAVRGGADFTQVVRTRRLRMVASSQSLTRQEASQLPPALQRLAQQMFAAPEGGVVSSLSPDAGSMILAHIESVRRDDPAQAPERVEAGRAQIQQSLEQSMGEAVQNAIIASTNPRRNTQLVARMYPSATDTPDAAQ